MDIPSVLQAVIFGLRTEPRALASGKDGERDIANDPSIRQDLQYLI